MELFSERPSGNLFLAHGGLVRCPPSSPYHLGPYPRRCASFFQFLYLRLGSVDHRHELRQKESCDGQTSRSGFSMNFGSVVPRYHVIVAWESPMRVELSL